LNKPSKISTSLAKRLAAPPSWIITEQTSWILFLKYLDDLEGDRKIEAELRGITYIIIMDAAHRWSVWAAPKNS
jgi:hypothetical protein